MKFNEELRIADIADTYYRRYRPYMEALSRSALAKVRGGLQPHDVYALGKQLEQFEAYRQLCEEEGNINQLGRIPQVAFDVITAVQGASILPVLASVQPIEEEQGIIYFKTVRAASTRGNLTAGQKITDPRSGVVTPQGYTTSGIEGEVVATGNGTDRTFTAIIANKPVKSQSLVVTLENQPAVIGRDIGPDANGIGQIYGQGVHGTVNYITGQVTLNFFNAPANGAKIFAAYQTNFELAADIPQIDSFFDSRTITAQIFALRGSVGMLQSFGLKKRFGLVAEDELAKDLVTEINKEIGGTLIKKLYASAMGETQWSRNPPQGVSYYEYKMTFKDALARAESTLLSNAYRGTISTIVAGTEVCAIMQTLPGFSKLHDGTSLGAHVFGTLDGVTIVRVPEAAVLPANEAICLWIGKSGFETAAIYSPFMPLVVTSTIPRTPNPFVQVRAAAVWAGLDVVVPQFATRLKIVD